MADLEKENLYLRQIINGKDTAILGLQLQVLQLTQANSEVNNEQTKSNEVPTSDSESGDWSYKSKRRWQNNKWRKI